MHACTRGAAVLLLLLRGLGWPHVCRCATSYNDVTFSAQVAAETTATVQLAVRGEKLEKKDWFGKVGVSMCACDCA